MNESGLCSCPFIIKRTDTNFPHVRSFIKRTNTNELPAEWFTNCSLNVRFVCSPMYVCEIREGERCTHEQLG
ncbi:hypothetical protein Hanom_Chr10g00946841 [Helianthus anomalus]